MDGLLDQKNLDRGGNIVFLNFFFQLGLKT